MKKDELISLVFVVVGGSISIGAILDICFDIWDILPTFGLIGFSVVFLGKFLLRGVGLLGIGLMYLGILSLRT